MGTVKFVDGANVYITDASGNVVKVVTNGASADLEDRPGHHEGRRARPDGARARDPERGRLVHRELGHGDARGRGWRSGLPVRRSGRRRGRRRRLIAANPRQWECRAGAACYGR